MCENVEVCRVCLTADVRMVEIAGTPLQVVYERLTNIPLHFNNFPVEACYMCCAELRRSQALMETATRATSALSELLATNKITKTTVSQISHCIKSIRGTLAVSKTKYVDIDIEATVPNVNIDKVPPDNTTATIDVMPSVLPIDLMAIQANNIQATVPATKINRSTAGMETIASIAVKPTVDMRVHANYVQASVPATKINTPSTVNMETAKAIDVKSPVDVKPSVPNNVNATVPVEIEFVTDPARHIKVEVKEEPFDLDETSCPLMTTKVDEERGTDDGNNISSRNPDEQRRCMVSVMKEEVLEEMNQPELPGTSRMMNCSDGVMGNLSESELDSQGEPKTKRRRNKHWVFYHKFSNIKQAKDFVNSENTWGRQFTRTTEEGQKRFYRCNKVPKRGPQCAAELYLLFECGTDSIFVYRTDAGHNHDNIGVRDGYGINAQTKIEINKLFDLHLKPKDILAALRKIDGIKMPTKLQLNNYLCDRRRVKFGKNTIDLGELENWIHDNENEPENDDIPFVMNYWLTSDQTNFSFVLSTKKLLKLACYTDVLHADATNKLIWQGFPVSIVGTTNKSRKFYPLCLAVFTNDKKENFEMVFSGLKEKIRSLFDHDFKPKLLVYDATEAIKNAFLNVFGFDTTVRTCWTLAKKSMQKKIDQSVEKDFRKEILRDIDALHNTSSPDIFNAASQAFINKHYSKTAFIQYFKEEWIDKNPNWFLGASETLSPSTNNDLDAFYKSIKDNNTMRERFPLIKFLTVANEIIALWSNDILKESYLESPKVELKEWTEAYCWAKQNVDVKLITSDDVKSIYLVPNERANAIEITYDNSWHTFDEFKEKNFSFYKIELPRTEWHTGKCSCSQFFEMYTCKHILGLAIRLKLAIPPVEPKLIPIRQTRKRGRPTKSKPAPIIQ